MQCWGRISLEILFPFLLHTNGTHRGVAIGAGFEVFADVAGAVREGGGDLFVYAVDAGGVGVYFEEMPVGIAGGDAAFGVFDLAADGACRPCVLAFVVGVDAPMDGDLAALAEVEEQQRWFDGQNLLFQGGCGRAVGDGKSGSGTVGVGGCGITLDALGVIPCQRDGRAERRVLRCRGGFCGGLCRFIVGEGRGRRIGCRGHSADVDAVESVACAVADHP